MIKVTIERRLRVELVTMQWYDPDDRTWKLFGQVPGVLGDIITIDDEDGSGIPIAHVHVE